MRRFFHPPPPASSLTRFDRHCYNHLSCHHLTSHHLTSLLLVLCLALGLVACQSGGSSASSANNDENISVKDGSDSSGNDDSDIGDDISFADLSDDTKTIIGMREFLLTVTFDNLTDKESLTFIVGETSTAPEWSSVQNNPVRITRAFDNGSLKTRRIYFSATEKLTDVSFDADGNATISGKVIDLSQDGQTEAQITKAQAAGIMIPSTSYYVYVYDSRGALVKQQKVTTAGYPGQSEFATAQIDPTGNSTPPLSNEAYFWGTNIWSRVLFNPRTDSDAEKNKLGVEMRRGEVVFYPMRRRPSFDWDQDFTAAETEAAKNFRATYNCNPDSYQHKLDIRERPDNGTFGTVLTIIKDGVDETGDGLVFFKSPSLLPNINPAERNRVFDIMYLVRPNSDYDHFERCRDSGDIAEKLVQVRIYKPVSLVSE